MALEFTTARKTREDRPITVDLCGEEITLTQPKDAPLYFGSVVTAETATMPERASGYMELVRAVFDETQLSQFHQRIQDTSDPVNFQATADLLEGVQTRWGDWDPSDTSVLVVEPSPSLLPDAEPTVITVDGHELTAHPPKDLMVFVLVAASRNAADVGEQARAVGMFLDAAFELPNRIWLSDRMRNRADDFDLGELIDIMGELLHVWYPEGKAPVVANREQRRAASRQKSSSGASKSAGTRSGSSTAAKGSGQRKTGSSSSGRTPARR